MFTSIHGYPVLVYLRDMLFLHYFHTLILDYKLFVLSFKCFFPSIFFGSSRPLVLLQQEWVDYRCLLHPSRQVTYERLLHRWRQPPGVGLVVRKPSGDLRSYPIPGVLQKLTQPRLPQLPIDVSEGFRPGEDLYGHLFRLEVQPHHQLLQR